MNFEKYTERARGFVQVAQDLAQRSAHQQLVPEHLLKALLDDEEGLCANLIRAAGGDAAGAEQAVELALGKLPKVEGGVDEPALPKVSPRPFTLASRPQWPSPTLGFRGMKQMPMASQNGRS